jgi:hypothetical protein
MEKMSMPTLTALQSAARDAENTILKQLLPGAKTLAQLGTSRHRMKTMLEAKLVKRSAPVKNHAGVGRKAVAYELTAKGRKRAEKL